MIQTRCYERPHGRPSSAWTRWRRRPEPQARKRAPPWRTARAAARFYRKVIWAAANLPGSREGRLCHQETEHNHKRTLFEFTLVRRLALLGPFGRAVVKNLPLHALHVLLPAPNTQA